VWPHKNASDREQRMTRAEFTDLIAQIADAKREVASWPEWMRNAAVMASASFPKEKISEANIIESSKLDKPND
jgi:hypothetical protein